jgi:geranylgeranyl diphosphate synthase, type II
MTLDEYLKACATETEAALERLVPKETEEPVNLHKAMRYSLFAGGKRIRPVLCLSAGAVIADHAPGLADVAASLEMIHTYSLIHDDLPALDNDDLRRGLPTNHKKFGEAMAILAGDALLTMAFETLAHCSQLSPPRRVAVMAELSTAAGARAGMIGGQVHDIEGEAAQPTAALLERIHRAKTGALLRASVRMGAMAAGANDEQLAALSSYGEHIGLAFQIVDDVLDVEMTSEQLGKTAGKDSAQQKITFPAVYGLPESKRMAEEERASAHAALQSFGSSAQWLRKIADLIVDRQS